MFSQPSPSTDPTPSITFCGDPSAVSTGPDASPNVLASEVDQLADALAARFEELTLIHGLTQRLASSLTLTEQSNQVARSLLDELAPCIASSILAIHLFPGAGPEESTTDRSAMLPLRYSDEIFEIVGHPIADSELVAIVQATRAKSKQRTGDSEGVALVNDLQLGNGNRLRAVVVPIHRGTTSLGQMVAIRTVDQPEFGTIEADMMSSTSTMLAVHLLNQQQYQQMQGMFESMIQSLASALDAKDAYTCGHSNRVAELSFQLAARLGYDDHALANIRMGGILHDIGKIGVDDSVLRKPTRLTDEEFEQIKRHPVLGYDILKGIEQFRPILPAVRHHHESWDGSGYPDGLAGNDIPRDAQIVAVADAFDAMSSDRPYRPGMEIEKVVKIFREGRGIQWAADVVDTLLSLPNLQQHS
ncbi:Cyclic di-GMP phosphodiesterase response regulator RpfG [Stieleria neptunia]|uniref:Cyclic di-GMP phosphodiesterase response regulator RpfG n=1 Tax=Stieleria neptunia TaxID=2527979 RepID=A0A518HZ72_9BACT|nr:HD-GYP domain-containing protein [Stieleria neptunia]QDV46143.1 Cyclic di-GMP phosphodiesterase response regulator RpfG [Stieleria neptunia]